MTPAANEDAHPARCIAVVDDDPEIREMAAAYLREYDYVVRTAGDADELNQLLGAGPVDLILLDLMLPGEDGLSICRRLSMNGGPAIIMMSARGEEIDRVLGLEMGADDYLAKPCSLREVLARVRAVFRRIDEGRGGGLRRSRTYRFQGFLLDVQRRQLRAPSGVAILLTAAEMSLLMIFLENPQRILNREQLLEFSPDPEIDASGRTVDMLISRLRRKLHDCADSPIIKTVRGAGYFFEPTVSRP
jgi:two-component system OmpR family response regulator